MKKIDSFILSLMFTTVMAPGLLRAASSSANFTVYSNIVSAQGTGTSASYKNVSSLGLLAADSMGASFKNNAGFFAPQSVITDNNISFFDETPAADEWQPTTSVTPKITIQMTAGNAIASVQYRVSNSGPTWATPTTGWNTAAVYTTVNATTRIYEIAIPDNAGQYFLEGENNYIQWLVTNDAAGQGRSGIYRVRVRVNDAPLVTITQPDIKSEYTSLLPYIAATVVDQYGGINASSLQIKIDLADGANVATITSSELPGIYDAASGLLAYKYAGTALLANTQYKLTVTASDNRGVTGSDSLTFTPLGGAIADLVPYPSPFDPKIQPVVIRYVLDARSDVWVNIYDMSGRIVKNIVEAQSRGPGICEDKWYGNNFAGEELANGIYICEIKAKNENGENRRYTSLAIFGK